MFVSQKKPGKRESQYLKVYDEVGPQIMPVFENKGLTERLKAILYSEELIKRKMKPEVLRIRLLALVEEAKA